jgi:hypothetical protein
MERGAKRKEKREKSKEERAKRKKQREKGKEKSFALCALSLLPLALRQGVCVFRAQIMKEPSC